MEQNEFITNVGAFLNEVDASLATIEQLTMYLLDNKAEEAPSQEVQELLAALETLQEKVTSKWEEIEELYEE